MLIQSIQFDTAISHFFHRSHSPEAGARPFCKPLRPFAGGISYLLRPLAPGKPADHGPGQTGKTAGTTQNARLSAIDSKVA
jgi:hypothetical protein